MKMVRKRVTEQRFGKEVREGRIKVGGRVLLMSI